jgi:hypothetical protein
LRIGKVGMNSRFQAGVLVAKVVLLVLGVAWAVFALRGLMFLADAFPSAAPVAITPARLLADAQGYALVWGPAALALVLLSIRWPLKRGATDAAR